MHTDARHVGNVAEMRVVAVTWLAGFSARMASLKMAEGEAQSPQSALQLQHFTANAPAHLNAAALTRETQRTGGGRGNHA